MFYEVYKKLCDERGISPSRAADEMDINRSAISTWKAGTSKPRNSNIKKISEYFGVSIEYLNQYINDVNTETVSSQEPHDIEEELIKIIEELKYTKELKIYGFPVTEKIRATLLDTIRIGTDAVKYIITLENPCPKDDEDDKDM